MGLKNADHNNMPNIRRRLLAERGSVCQECGYAGYVEVHHKNPVSDGGLDHPENLILLCELCHSKAHGQKNKSKFLDPNRKNWRHTP